MPVEQIKEYFDCKDKFTINDFLEAPCQLIWPNNSGRNAKKKKNINSLWRHYKSLHILSLVRSTDENWRFKRQFKINKRISKTTLFVVHFLFYA